MIFPKPVCLKVFSLKTPPSTPGRRSPLGPEGPRLDWRKFTWVAILFLLVAWMWQEGLSQLNVKNIPYSHFKQLLAQGKIAACSIEEKEIVGRVDPARHTAGNREPPAATQAPRSAGAPGSEKNPKSSPEKSVPKPYFFRTTRVDDPKLTAELEAAKIEFTGARPGPLSVLLASWGVPLGIMLIFWLAFRRMLARPASVFLALAGAAPGC